MEYSAFHSSGTVSLRLVRLLAEMAAVHCLLVVLLMMVAVQVTTPCHSLLFPTAPDTVATVRMEDGFWMAFNFLV
jgi:hypothetical protein